MRTVKVPERLGTEVLQRAKAVLAGGAGGVTLLGAGHVLARTTEEATIGIGHIPELTKGAAELLSLGLIGLAFLLALLSGWLLHTEIRQTRAPSTGALATIGFYLIVTVGLLIVVGFFQFGRRSVTAYVVLSPELTEKVLLPSVRVKEFRKDLDGSVPVLVAHEEQIIVGISALLEEVQRARRTVQATVDACRAQQDKGYDDVGS